MSIARCPTCQQALSPGDEIGEKCGAILVPTPAYPVAPARAGVALAPACPRCNTPRRPETRFCSL